MAPDASAAEGTVIAGVAGAGLLSSVQLPSPTERLAATRRVADRLAGPAVRDCRGILDPRRLPEPGRLRMPAEWEARRGTWLGWPSNPETWFELGPAVRRVYREIVRALAPDEEVHLLVGSPGDEAHARGILGTGYQGEANVSFHTVPIDDCWLRDSGPIFVRDGQTGRLAITDWDFDKWGGKYPPWDRDDAVPSHVARIRAMERWIPGMTLEGGSIDPDGLGTVLTTEQCLLNPNRNPWASRRQIEERLRAFLGFETTIWLGRGIEGDDTDGHVDDIARFVAPGIVVAATEDDPNDENHLALRQNLATLRAARDARGQRIEVVELPMPRPVVTRGLRTPASYCNFLIGAKSLLLPVFGDRRDAIAIRRLEAVANRRIVPIDCRELVFGQGAIHCISQQEPAG